MRAPRSSAPTVARDLGKEGRGREGPRGLGCGRSVAAAARGVAAWGPGRSGAAAARGHLGAE